MNPKKLFHGSKDLSRENEELKRLLKKAERAAAECSLSGGALESRNLLKAVVDNSTAIIYVKDLEGKYLLVNRRFADLFHISPESAVGKTDQEILPGEIADACRAFDLRVMDAGTALEGEETVPQDDGPHTYLSIKSPLFDDKGKSYALFGICTDITCRKKAEEERLSHVRFLENIERVDKAIRQADNPEEMMAEVLDTALHTFDSDRAWLLFPCDPDASSWSVPMERTRKEYPGAFAINFQFPKTQESSEAFRAALNSSDPIVHDPRSGLLIPTLFAEKFSVCSQIALAVYPKHGSPWLFGMHQCSYPRVWTDEDIRLFKVVGSRVADSLGSLLFLRDLKAEEDALQKANKELQNKMIELEKFIKLTVGRELKIVELKDEIKRLKEELTRKAA